MRELPHGTVTFLFTDIEGSTRLLEELGSERYASELAEHRGVLRDAFERHGGVEVDTQGDAFFVAFPTAPGALAAAAEAQEELGLPVRMGLHTGTPLLTDEGYVGSDVHRAARIAAAGHGRQVLVSSTTAALVDRDVLRDLGEHRLKDLSAAERIFQLGDAEFPPLKTLHRTNLPIPATPFLGRGEELAKVGELLGREETRLLVLTGAGGSGKTRLALQVAGAAADSYPQGVWWVPLTTLSDPADVLPAAAQALGGGGSLAELVAERRLLLLFDNFEHLVDAAAGLADVLSSCPNVDVLVTSRERLRLQGEQVYPVPVLAREDSRRFFVARARAAQPDFESDELVDELCDRLDDLPLALELAAARTPLLSTRQLLERLSGRLDFLSGGRDSETRQKTLRATIEWSYELLEPAERELLAALSIFRGGWTLEAAERVAAADLELMQSLVDKSLVRRWDSDRFGMLESIREYAAERLPDDDRDRLLRRLMEYLLELFDDANLRVRASGIPRTDLAQEERPNLDVVLQWAARSDPLAGLDLLELLETYWFSNDPVRGRELVDSLLAAAGPSLDPARRAAALRFRGSTWDYVGAKDRSELDYLEAIELFRSVGDDAEAWHLDLRVASCALEQGDIDRARGLVVERLERGGGHEADRAVGLGLLSQIAFAEDDAEEGVRLAHESANAADAAGLSWWRGVMLTSTAEVLGLRGEFDAAEADFADGLRALWDARNLINVCEALMTGCVLAALRGDAKRAGTLWGAVEAEAALLPLRPANDVLAGTEKHLDLVRGEIFEEACALGRTLSLEDAVAYALEP